MYNANMEHSGISGLLTVVDAVPLATTAPAVDACFEPCTIIQLLQCVGYDTIIQH